ncbi:hypothetical protein DFH27DRAFT_478669 [Peziza echinospora]|nr:hypothetical protein DFH27DRAFT_478669 [Peziza echinospora]
MSRLDFLGRLRAQRGLGRRGVLPSSVSRSESSRDDGVDHEDGGKASPASESPTGSTSISNIATSSHTAGQHQAVKDANGKFPCSSCHKTYLHLKHLKRHLLRHSGDRPYQCVLCKDTFSRSDILKRHFQKCSLRRGNPAGYTHLAHAHDHQRKKPTKNNRDQVTGHQSRPRNSEPYDSSISVLGPNSFNPSIIPDGSFRRPSMSSCDECSRLNIPCSGDIPCSRCQNIGMECNNTTGLEPRDDGSKDKNPSFQQQQPTQIPNTMTLRSSPSFQTIVDDGPYGLLGNEHNLSSTSLGEYSLQQHQARLQQQQQRGTPSHDDLRRIKSELETGNIVPTQRNNPLLYLDTASSNPTSQDLGWDYPEDDTLYSSISANLALQSQSSESSIYTFNSTPINTFNNTPITENNMPVLDGLIDWNMPIQTPDPFHVKCEHIRDLLFSEYNNPRTPEYVCTPPSEDGSLPPSDDHDLREWVTADHLTHFWELFCTHFQAHFPAMHLPTFNLKTAYDGILMGIMCYGAVYSDRGITVNQVRRLMERCMSLIEKSDQRKFSPTQHPRILSTDELQTRLLFSALCNWHGSDEQRERNRKEFGKLVTMARNSFFYRPLTIRDNSLGSWSYYHQTDRTLKLQREWNWMAWIEQEQRNRVMFGIYLLDAAFVLYWNEKPRIGIYELRLTLPSDDAAWDAATSEECANMLGINGPEASASNITGTRRQKQPELSAQVEELLTIGKDFAVGNTNAYGKFILIHALHVYISLKQKEFGLGQWGYQPDGSQNSNSQQKNLEILHFHQTIAQALDKFKRCWDADLVSQYPGIRRKGFCRDGIAFYWLAVLFTRQKKRDLVLRDVRDRHVISQIQQMLETVNRRPKSELPKPQRGATSDIDRTYGLDELAFDMKLLLTPIKKSPELKPEGEEAANQQLEQQQHLDQHQQHQQHHHQHQQQHHHQPHQHQHQHQQQQQQQQQQQHHPQHQPNFHHQLHHQQQ